MDANLAKKQIGVWNLMACGARQFLASSDRLQFTVGSNPNLLEKVIVTLADDDTYTVRYVVMSRRLCVVLVDETEEGIYCDSLGKTVCRMGDREWTAAKLAEVAEQAKVRAEQNAAEAA